MIRSATVDGCSQELIAATEIFLQIRLPREFCPIPLKHIVVIEAESMAMAKQFACALLILSM